MAGGHAVCFIQGRKWERTTDTLDSGGVEMADVARKQKVSMPGSAVREHLRALEDGDVVAAFLGGEERAFQELVSRYQTRLLNFIYRTIGDREKAEDLVQEVVIRVYRHIGRFDRS
jgi:RNA polymerase sigma-70 factor (ECF subfamily)